MNQTLAILTMGAAAALASTSTAAVRVVSFSDYATWQAAPTNPELALFPAGQVPLFETEHFKGMSWAGTQASASGSSGWSAWTATSTTAGLRSKGNGLYTGARGDSIDFAFAPSTTLPVGGVRGIGGGFQFFDDLGNFVAGKIWLKLSTGDNLLRNITGPTQFMGFWVTDPNVTITSIRIQPLGNAVNTYVGVSTLYMGTMANALPAPGSAAILGAAGMIGSRRRRA